MRHKCLAACGVLLLVSIAPARAEVSRIDVTSRTPVLGGKSFGLAGAYERLTGKVYFSVDPDLERNRGIVDLDKAPRDQQGRVTFSADIYILAPKDAARGNGVAFFDVVNRGRKNALQRFNRAEQGGTDINSEADAGDGFLMQRGYTVVWVGWQFDVSRTNGLMAFDPPVLSGITGRVSTLFTPNAAGPTFELPTSGYYDVSRYQPVDLTSAANQLTVREGLRGTPRPIARDQWQFSPNASSISLKAGFEAGKTYEVSFEAKGAVVAGLSFVVFRDLASYLKHAPAGAPVAARYAYVFGPSQDGRFLRDFMYRGFNADEQNRRAFDGVMAHIAGSSRGDFSGRFARPNGLGAFTASDFPYLDSPQHDPVTGKTDGLQSHMSADVAPKIVYTNSSTEYWGGGRNAALTHTTLDGKEDAILPENVRIYLLAGTQHGPAPVNAPRGATTQARGNPNDYTWGLRALLVALDRWVREGVPPPASRYPNLKDRTLVARTDVDFPAIPGLHSPQGIPGGYRSDLESPQTHPLPHLVPKVDADGNELGGIRFPETAVPLATYTGWNFRNPAVGAPDEIFPLAGSYVPFPATRAAREQTHDPRLSVEERYANRAAYLGQVTEATLKLIQEGYVLREDLAGVVDPAMARWDDVMKSAAPGQR